MVAVDLGPPRPRGKGGRADPPEADDRDPMQPARRFLRGTSFVRATVWIAARLAEGLEPPTRAGCSTATSSPRTS